MSTDIVSAECMPAEWNPYGVRVPDSLCEKYNAQVRVVIERVGDTIAIDSPQTKLFGVKDFYTIVVKDTYQKGGIVSDGVLVYKTGSYIRFRELSLKVYVIVILLFAGVITLRSLVEKTS